MDFWSGLDRVPGVSLDHKNLFGHNAPGLSWLSADSLPHFAAHTGDNSAGNGGNGHFAGSLVDIDIAIYAPINIAVAGYNSTAEATQSNHVQLDQSATQIAGVGGDGGNGNTAYGGDLAMQLLSDLHVLDHLA